jgi:hypothetical protein
VLPLQEREAEAIVTALIGSSKELQDVHHIIKDALQELHPDSLENNDRDDDVSTDDQSKVARHLPGTCCMQRCSRAH